MPMSRDDARRLVARGEIRIEPADGRAFFEGPALLDHDVVVIT
jgi:hypothetical protein